MEKWEIWNSINGIPLPCHIKKIISDEIGLTLSFLDETSKKEVIFTFNGAIYSYRFTMEGAFLKTLDYLYKYYKPEYFQSTSLFKVKNSKYLEWFKEESYDVYKTDGFEHYTFYTEDGAIEVLSPYAPEVIIKDV